MLQYKNHSQQCLISPNILNVAPQRTRMFLGLPAVCQSSLHSLNLLRYEKMFGWWLLRVLPAVCFQASAGLEMVDRSRERTSRGSWLHQILGFFCSFFVTKLLWIQYFCSIHLSLTSFQVWSMNHVPSVWCCHQTVTMVSAWCHQHNVLVDQSTS